jgi:pimeloyl-ACP methyl ester carboxylesterase
MPLSRRESVVSSVGAGHRIHMDDLKVKTSAHAGPSRVRSDGDILRVPGAGLFYRVRGSGPVLLILAGGDTDADTTDRLCDRLLDRFTVVTYDRRGLSRSTLDADTPPPSIETHADDAHRLLATVTHEPAFVFGNSIGGLSGLELVTRHPEQVRVLVAHEAPTRELLPAEESARLAAAQAEMENAFTHQGIAAAMAISARLAAIDPADKESDVPEALNTAQRQKNLAFLLTYDVPAVRRHRVDVATLISRATYIVPAAGQSTPETLLHRCSEALAITLGRRLVEFPGGHTGWLLRPNGFADALRQVLH